MLPFKEGCAEVYISHHGIDDVYETEGRTGLKKSLREAARVLTAKGRMLFSHCIFQSDEATFHVSLAEVREELAKLRNFKFVELKGERMDWLVVTSDENSLVREILVKRRRQNPHPR